MRAFSNDFTDIAYWRNLKHEPDFNNLLQILSKKTPDRPTLFEFFLNEDLYKALTDMTPGTTAIDYGRLIMKAYYLTGYDYVTIHGSDFGFPAQRHQEKKTVSLNEGGVIFDRKSFEAYNWLDPAGFDYSRLSILGEELPGKMKLIAYGPGGVLENVIALTGYETLCYMVLDDMPLVEDIFDAVGSRLVKYYDICGSYKGVGAMISNDDWGFNSQTMLSTDMMRKLVIPWHVEIVKTIHAHGMPAILHSCGQLGEVMDDIIDTIGFDGKHSYEDKILPVEEAYDRYGDRIAILGGIDLDFVCRSKPEEIFKRAAAMLEKTQAKGGYALGSGNSIPYYVPKENYLAMIAAAKAF